MAASPRVTASPAHPGESQKPATNPLDIQTAKLIRWQQGEVASTLKVTLEPHRVDGRSKITMMEKGKWKERPGNDLTAPVTAGTCEGR